MIGKKCPLGSMAECTHKCAWFVKDRCAVVAAAETLMKTEKPKKSDKE